MKLMNRIVIGASLLAGAQFAYATQPPDTVTSDSSGNTAAGSFALYSLTSGTEDTALGYAALYLNSTGTRDTAFGNSALYSNTTGDQNSAFGFDALGNNATGTANTASGNVALYNNTSGSDNTASGESALFTNTTGSSNTAVGQGALLNNTSASGNTAVGTVALFSNTTGTSNTALGYDSLGANTTGIGNTAAGQYSLPSNTTGANNTAFGFNALYLNTTGKGNAAQGVNALYNNTTGIRNLGIGSNALYDNTSGSYNVALGFDAGYNQTTGTDDIYISNQGVAGESQTLRLGTQGTSGVEGSGVLTAYIAGVAGSPVTGSAVYITAAGQLGVLASSERYKTEVAAMGESSEKLAELRPVTFKLKTDPGGTLQYGLIAEEVAKVYPELVVRGADGRIAGVRYEELAPMLLNVVQKELRTQTLQAQRIASQDRTIETLSTALRDVRNQLAELEALKHSMQLELPADRAE
jgi:trimeric autotransporter adhesin